MPVLCALTTLGFSFSSGTSRVTSLGNLHTIRSAIAFTRAVNPVPFNFCNKQQCCKHLKRAKSKRNTNHIIWSLVVPGEGGRDMVSQVQIFTVYNAITLLMFPRIFLAVTNMKLRARELLPCVSNFCLAEWQDIWDCWEGNKLHSIYPTVGILNHSKNISRYDSVLLNRLRIGYSRLTHSYLLCGDDPPTCQSCRIPFIFVVSANFSLTHSFSSMVAVFQS